MRIKTTNNLGDGTPAPCDYQNNNFDSVKTPVILIYFRDHHHIH